MHTCWGTAARDRIVKYGVPVENTTITGPIQMDFLRPQFKGYYKDKENLCKEFNLDPNKKLALYIACDVHDVKKDYLRITQGIQRDLRDQEES